MDIITNVCTLLPRIIIHMYKNCECGQDEPYLDLCVYPPKSSRGSGGNMEATMDFDRLSVCSMESVHLPPRPLPQVGAVTD